MPKNTIDPDRISATATFHNVKAKHLRKKDRINIANKLMIITDIVHTMDGDYEIKLKPAYGSSDLLACLIVSKKHKFTVTQRRSGTFREFLNDTSK